MALSVKENEFVVLCAHLPGETAEELRIAKASLNGREFCDIPVDKQSMKFHSEVSVCYLCSCFIGIFVFIFRFLFLFLFRTQANIDPS